MRLKSDIDKQNPIVRKPGYGDGNLVGKTSSIETKAKYLNDTYNKNPIEILSNSDNLNLAMSQKEKSSVKCQRVSDYLSSNGVKSSVANTINPITHVDKITNVDITRVKAAHEMDDPKQYKKSFPHMLEKKRVSYK